MSASLTSRPARRRVIAAFAALVFVIVSGSGVRVALPTVREATRGLVPAKTSLRRAVLSGRKLTTATLGGRHTAAALWRLVVTWLYAFPLLAPLPAMRGLPAGALAHDGVAKRRRWASLGGHGRHGAG